VQAGYAGLPVTTHGPTGDPVTATIACRGSGAVVEVANSCGLLLLPGGIRAPMSSSSRGLGDAIVGALDAGASHVLICLGGGAATDGGTGMLVALGARLHDSAGDPVSPCGANLRRIAGVDLSGLDPRIGEVAFTVAADVSSPLLGPSGAATVFGPQKGAGPDDVGLLEEGMRSWAGILSAATSTDAVTTPGAGASGGLGFAALAALGAGIVSGAAHIASILGLADAIAEADLVITGEGRLDHQSVLGKGALGVARSARDVGVGVIMACGRIDLEDDELARCGVRIRSALTDGTDETEAMAEAAHRLAEATAAAVRLWSPPSVGR
jgi:glycerate kinase